MKSFAGVPSKLFLQVENPEIYEHSDWLQILFYVPKLFSKQKSIFDSDKNFASPEGASNPKLEMLAILKGMFEEPDPANDDNHILCRFPARSRILQNILKIDKGDLPKPRCQKLQDQFSKKKFKAISLVFSSYYTNNPASLFGHTFLQLHTDNAEQKLSSKLLDIAVNYVAYPPPESSGLIHYLRGAFGGFPGKFDTPFMYLKVQEYNNHEQRDLWHYELNFSQDDLHHFIEVLWEQQEAFASYWYFDDNCSLVVLMTLSAAKPELNLYSYLKHPWIIPSDTLKAVVEAPGLLKKIDYTPSTRTQFLAKFERLSDLEKNIVHDSLIQNKLLISPGADKNIRELETLDALVELIDFKEDIAGSSLGDVFKSLRQQALTMRAGLGKPSPIILITPPLNDAPHLAHPSTRWGLGLATGKNSDGISSPSIELEWRPALHDQVDLGLGFPPGLEIEFMKTQVSIRQDSKPKFLLRDFTLFRGFSLPQDSPEIRSLAWLVHLGGQQIESCGEKYLETCWSHYLQFGFGKTWTPLQSSLTLFALFASDSRLVHDSKQIFSLGPGSLLGLSYSIKRTLGIFVSAFPRYQVSKDDHFYRWNSEAILSYRMARDFEARIWAQAGLFHQENEIGLSVYMFR